MIMKIQVLWRVHKSHQSTNSSCTIALHSNSRFVHTYGKSMTHQIYTYKFRGSKQGASGETIRDKKIIKCDDAYFYNAAKKEY